MSSSCYFQFKSQKEPTRVTFDGTGVSVFELKREIINISKLGDGSDFDLSIYNKDTNEEYDDDTAVVPRSTSVIARRLPASKPGQGRAARYVSGRMPVTAKNSHRTETHSSSTTTGKVATGTHGAAAMDKAVTEEERIAAMFQMGADQWEEQKQHMAGQQAIYRPGGAAAKKPGPDPDQPLPSEYVCYRCGVKGHHIRNCPTNNDPKFDGKPRVVRTVGIPRSFLQQIEKPAEIENDGFTDEAKQPTSRWVDSEGNAVAAIPDSASWANYQAKAQASAAKNENAVATGSKELQDQGLECSIDKRLFVDPVKTPCCGVTYCHECIENALINSDLVCPGCTTEGVLLDNLVADDETIAKIKAYELEKQSQKTGATKSKSPTPTAPEDQKAKSPSPKPTVDGDVSTPKSQSSEPTKKRPADEELVTDRIPKGPAAMQRANSNNAVTPQVNAAQMPDQAFIEQMNALAGTNGMNPMSGMNGFPPIGMGMGMNMNMNMPGMMGMPPQMMMNPMMMQQFMGMGGMGPMGMNGMPNMGMPQQFNNNNGMGYGGGGRGVGGGNMGWQQGQGQGQMGRGQFGNFANQQQAQGDSPYMRQPLNPHRSQNKGRKARPMDYREL